MTTLKLTHNVPSMEDFTYWDVKEAFPSLDIIIEGSVDTHNRFTLVVAIEGHYTQCSGLEVTSMILDEADVGNQHGLTYDTLTHFLKEHLEDTLLERYADRIVEVIMEGIWKSNENEQNR